MPSMILCRFKFFLAGLLLLAMAALGYGMHMRNNATPMWQWLRIPNPSIQMNDLNTILIGAGLQRKGENPLRLPGSGYDHPRLWISILNGLGLTTADSLFIAASWALLFAACIVVLIFRAQTRVEVMLLFSAALSPAVLLGIQRGNSDIFIFVMTFAGAMLTPALAVTCATFAALLKLFPFFGMFASLFFKHYQRWFLPAIIVIVGYFIFTYADIVSISRKVPVAAFGSYGLLSLLTFLNQQARAHHLSPGSTEMLHIGLLALLELEIVGACWAATTSTRYKKLLLPEADMRLFLVFGFIYLGTFLLGSNWNYRLIFLIPLIPLLARLAQQRVGIGPIIALVLLQFALYVEIFGYGWDALGMPAEIALIYYVVYFSVLLLKHSDGVRMLMDFRKRIVYAQ